MENDTYIATTSLLYLLQFHIPESHIDTDSVVSFFLHAASRFPIASAPPARPSPVLRPCRNNKAPEPVSSMAQTQRS